MWLAGRGAGHPDSPPFRTHRAQLSNGLRTKAFAQPYDIRITDGKQQHAGGVRQYKALECLPRKRPALATTVEPPVGNPPYLMHELLHRREVERNAVVADMTAYLGAQQPPELLGRTSATGVFRPLVHRLEFGTQSFAVRLHLYQRTAPTGPAPVEGETQKVEHRLPGPVRCRTGG